MVFELGHSVSVLVTGSLALIGWWRPERTIYFPAADNHCHCSCQCESEDPSWKTSWLQIALLICLGGLLHYGWVSGRGFARILAARQVLSGAIRGRTEMAREVHHSDNDSEQRPPIDWFLRRRNTRR